MASCNPCGGTGVCDMCNGKGQHSHTGSGKVETCKHCRGTGKCGYCHGSGMAKDYL